MDQTNKRKLWTGVALAAVAVVLGSAYAQQAPQTPQAQQAPQPPRGKSSYMPVEITEPFSSMFARTSAQKPTVEQRAHGGSQ